MTYLYKLSAPAGVIKPPIYTEDLIEAKAWNREGWFIDIYEQAARAPQSATGTAEPIGYVNSGWASAPIGTAKVYTESHPRLATCPVFAALQPARQGMGDDAQGAEIKQDAEASHKANREMQSALDDPMWADHCEIPKKMVKSWQRALRMSFSDGYMAHARDAADEPTGIPSFSEIPVEGDCPHAAPFRYCDGCKVSPCPIGLGEKK